MPKPPLAAAEIREEFKRVVHALDRGCIASRPVRNGEIASPCEGRLHSHHVISQQQLRKRGLDHLLWDPANGAVVCERHHRRHHNRSEPISEMMLPQRCLDFIAKHDLSLYLDRYYAA